MVSSNCIRHLIRWINLYSSKPINISGLRLRWSLHENREINHNWLIGDEWLDFGAWLQSEWTHECYCPLYIIIRKAWWEWKWYFSWYSRIIRRNSNIRVVLMVECTRVRVYRSESLWEWFEQNSNYGNNNAKTLYVHVLCIYLYGYSSLCESVSLLK